MSLSYKEFLTMDIRLCILKALQQDPGYSCNEAVLQSILEMFGHKISRDKVRTELDWLAEQGMITLTHAMDIKVANLTLRGDDVAAGRAFASGVKRPLPSER